MARPRKWASEAERVAHYREEKRKALQTEELPERSVDEDPDRPVVADVEPDEATQQLGVSLEDYVAQIVREAAAYADSVAETDAPYTIAEGVVIENRRSDRLRRAEGYARWRYQGVLDGEVERL